MILPNVVHSLWHTIGNSCQKSLAGQNTAAWSVARLSPHAVPSLNATTHWSNHKLDRHNSHPQALALQCNQQCAAGKKTLMITTNSLLGILNFKKASQDLKLRGGNRWTLRSNYSSWTGKCFSRLNSYNSADGDCNRKLELIQIIDNYRIQIISHISQPWILVDSDASFCLTRKVS